MINKEITERKANEQAINEIASSLPEVIRNEWDEKQSFLPAEIRKSLPMQIGALNTRINADPKLRAIIYSRDFDRNMFYLNALYYGISGLDLGPSGMNKAEIWFIPYGNTIGMFPSVDGYAKIGKYCFGATAITCVALTKDNHEVSLVVNKRPEIKVNLKADIREDEYIAAIAHCDVEENGETRTITYYLDKSEQARIFRGIGAGDGQKPPMARNNWSAWLKKTAMKHLMQELIRLAKPKAGIEAVNKIISTDDTFEGYDPNKVLVTGVSLKPNEALENAVIEMIKANKKITPKAVLEHIQAELLKAKQRPSANFTEWVLKNPKAEEKINHIVASNKPVASNKSVASNKPGIGGVVANVFKRGKK